MKYIAKIWALGKFPEIKLDKDRYESLRVARTILVGARAIEEKFDILLSN